jgi:hypothetical protein
LKINYVKNKEQQDLWVKPKNRTFGSKKKDLQVKTKEQDLWVKKQRTGKLVLDWLEEKNI